MASLRKSWFKADFSNELKIKRNRFTEIVRGRYVMKGEIIFYDSTIKDCGSGKAKIAADVSDKLSALRRDIDNLNKRTNDLNKRTNAYPKFIRFFLKLIIGLVHFLFGKKEEKIKISESDIHCCCDGNLVKIANNEAYEICTKIKDFKLDLEVQNLFDTYGIGLNDVVFAKEGPRPPISETDVPENLDFEGDAYFFPIEDIPLVSCKNSTPPGHMDNLEKPKLKLGVIDMGLKNLHGNFIYQIIKERIGNRPISIRDYNIIETSGFSNVHSLCCQILKAIKDKADILNISMGYPSISATPSTILRHHIKLASDQNMIIVTSAGNAGESNNRIQHWPSNFASEIKNVLGVGAKEISDEQEIRSAYSNHGTQVKYFANGNHMVDASLFSNYISVSDPANFSIQGTSYSAAVVSASSALKKLIGNSNSEIIDDFLTVFSDPE